VDRAGFEPATSALRSQFHAANREKDVDWSDFESYVFHCYSNRNTALNRIRYARKFADCLLSGNYSRLLELSDDKRAHVLKALSCLAKYLGVYEEFRRAIREYGFKWTGRDSDSRIIDRLTKVVDPNEVFDWIRQVKKLNPDLEDFMDFMAVTGLRLKEAVKSYNLIIHLSEQDRLHDYFNEKNQCLEHFRFKELFIQRTKKAFISFVPVKLVEQIGKNKAISIYVPIGRVKQQKIKQRFGDIREAHATFMTKFLRPSEIDFLHGRVSSSIFMRNYFNPALIKDLKERVFKGINEIMEMIK